MNTSQPATDSFQETFCAQYGVPPALFDATVLRLTLYPHARWPAAMSPRAFLAPDRSFIARVGRLTRWHGFAGEVHAFQCEPANQRFWRRRLRLRISVTRMRALFSEVMGGTTSPSTSESSARAEAKREPGSLVID